MAAEAFTRSVDRLLASIAGRQFGVVARWQLLEAGVTRHEIQRRLADGRLTRLHHGVYLVGAVKPTHADEMAALLAFNLKATLSHRSAAALWDLIPYPATTQVWVTIPPERSANRPRIRTTRARLERRDIRKRHGMALTSPPRTILDLAALTPDLYELERIVAEAHFRRLAKDLELRGQLDRNPRRRGNGRLREVLDLPGGPQRTRSPGERALLRLLRSREVAGFQTNQDAAGHEVDFLFADERLIVELDGFDGHSSRQAFERDRLKWAELQAADYRVMPVTGRQIRDDPDGVVSRLLATRHARRVKDSAA